MCSPLAATSLGVSAASSIAGAASASSQAKATAKEDNARYRSVSDAAIESYQADLKQLSMRSAQEDAALAQTATENAQQAEDARGTTLVRAAGAGVSGESIEAILAEFSAIEAENESALKKNREWSKQSMRDTAEQLRSNATQRIAGAAPRKIKGPSPFGLALDIAGAGLQAYGDYKHDRPPSIKTT
jgi:hypothetical protein